MTQAVAVRRDGDAFQARQFWLRAARLLDPKSPIVRVGFESGPRGFDDIWVEYDSNRKPITHNGTRLKREYLQCKWHVTPGAFGYVDLADPGFINANARSLLQRARDAQMKHAPCGMGVRFKLVSNWSVNHSDPLSAMINNRSGNFRLKRLFGSKTDNSKEGRVRKLWREHLEIDENELRLLVQTLAFGYASVTLEELRERLDDVCAVVGLVRTPLSQSSLIYDDVVFQWMAQGRLEFDQKTFREACAQECLLSQSEVERPTVFGVKSFEHAFDPLENRCEDTLNLVEAFDERYIRNDSDWEFELYPRLQAFLTCAAQKQPRLRLALDAHTTIAFTAGSILNLKAGRDVELEQRTLGRRIWSADDMPIDPAWPELQEFVIDIKAGKSDLAIALGITHCIRDDVQKYVETHVPSVGKLINLQPSTGPNAQAVASGRHAFELVQFAKNSIRKARSSQRKSKTHIFLAAPNALTFFLGQQLPMLGRVILYEFDFEGGRCGSYSPSLSLPLCSSIEEAQP